MCSLNNELKKMLCKFCFLFVTSNKKKSRDGGAVVSTGVGYNEPLTCEVAECLLNVFTLFLAQCSGVDRW